MLYIRFPLPLRNVEELFHERRVEISHEPVRLWWHRFGPMFASEIRKRRIEGMRCSRWRSHLDKIFVKIYGERDNLWRAADHEGEPHSCCRRLAVTLFRFGCKLRRVRIRLTSPNLDPAVAQPLANANG